ncbi:MAG: hypothetical protein Q9218_006018 [Villophora microphyllina]
MTRSDSSDSALLSSTNGNSSKGDKDSTPATSMADTASIAFDTTPKPRLRGEGSRSLRTSRSNISSYNENVLSGSAKHGYRKKAVDASSRAVSGETLVDGKSDSPTSFVRQSTRGLNQDWSPGALPGDNLNISTEAEKLKRRKSTRLSVLEFASNVMEQTRTVLGKRGREPPESSMEKTAAVKQESIDDTTPKNAETPSFEEPASKRLRFEASVNGHPSSSSRIQRKPAKRPAKRWLSQGLYVGQDPDFNPRLTTTKNKMKKSDTKPDLSQRRSLLPLPMFAGKRIVDIGRDFKLPFDVFSPLPPGQPKPDEWKKTQKSKVLALEILDNADQCAQIGCDQDCLNRHMFYECDDANCNVGADRCNNRRFEELKERNRKGGKYNIGVEVIKTADRGHGVRSNRTFNPHQIIVEYTGEIITQDECDERMETRYKDNECFYLMEFDQRMILDATRGSIARFINHSCEPNCEMIKMTVAGKPRMALFAGENGIMTGDELTYDYNFNPYSVKNVQQCRCGAPSCRGVLGPKPKEIKDALKPLTSGGGGKRKFQQVVEEGIQSVRKKRKINIPSGVRKALSDVKAQTAETVGKFVKQEEGDENQALPSSLARLGLRKSKSTSLLEKSATMTTYSRHRRSSAAAAAVKVKEELDEDAPISRRSSVKAAASSVRKNVVRTVKGRSGLRGKSIRVIEDDWAFE